MAALFGIDVRSLASDVFGGNLQDGTLHVAAESIGPAGDTMVLFSDHTVEGVQGRWKTAVMVARGYSAETVKIMLLQQGLAVTPVIADEITISGTRYRVTDVESGAGDATWRLAAVAL